MLQALCRYLQEVSQRDGFEAKDEAKAVLTKLSEQVELCTRVVAERDGVKEKVRDFRMHRRGVNRSHEEIENQNFSLPPLPD